MSNLVKQMRATLESKPEFMFTFLGVEAPLPVNINLPQSHTEEVRVFLQIAERLDSEKESITPEEFQELLRMLPQIFPGMRRS